MRFRPIAGVWVGVLCASLLAPAEARAHGHLVRSRPARGDTLRVAPRLLRLEFSETPELSMSRVRLVDSLRREIGLLPVHADGDSTRVLIADIAGHLAAGRYTVLWQIAGRDGHPVHGEFAFVVAGDSAAAHETTAGPVPIIGQSPSSPAMGPMQHPVPSETHQVVGFDSESLPYVFSRWAQFVGLLVVIGAVVFRFLVLERAPREQLAPAVVADATARAVRLAALGAVLVSLSAAARLMAQWTALRVDAVAASAMPLGRVLWLSLWGHAWLVQVAALIVLAVGLLLARHAGREPLGWGIAALAAVVLACTPAFSGHAAASGTATPVIIDALHVLAAGGWMGTLLVVLAAGLPATRSLGPPARGRAMAALVNTFSGVALACAALVVVTGLLASLRNVETLSALARSAYGNMLLRKLFFLAIAAVIGLYNWRRARTALAASGDDTAIRRAMQAELAAGVAILLITAFLVAIPLPLT
jgi:putative copper export protein/methionine-rich copper-binding protein CopC